MSAIQTMEYGTEMAAACADPVFAGQPEQDHMNWYCIHAKPRKETGIAGYLRSMLGLETYFPHLRRPRTIRRVRRVVTEPLFPCYLFCRFDFSQKYRAVRYAPDVSDIVSFGGVSAVVNDGLIEGLKSWAGECVDIITLQPALHPGDPIVVTDGPLRGLEGVILSEAGGRERVAVALSILERDVQMKISRWQIAPRR